MIAFHTKKQFIKHDFLLENKLFQFLVLILFKVNMIFYNTPYLI